VLFEALIFMVIFFSVIHYTNRAVNRKNNALFGPQNVVNTVPKPEDLKGETKSEEPKAEEKEEKK
jgi:hypothetical protein